MKSLHFLYSLASASTLAAALGGCTVSSTEPHSSGGGTQTPGGDSGLRGANAPDAAACVTIVASDFDQSCSVDTDCVRVVNGGPVCDPCSDSYNFTCPAANVSASASAAYVAALTAALGKAPGLGFSVGACGGQVVSCPVGRAACVSGQCKTVAP